MEHQGFLVDSDNDEALALPSGSTLRSQVWKIFEKIEIDVDNVKVLKAKCSICGDLLSRGPNSGTSHLKRHMKRHGIGSSGNDNKNKQLMIGANSDGNICNFQFYDNVTIASGPNENKKKQLMIGMNSAGNMCNVKFDENAIGQNENMSNFQYNEKVARKEIADFIIRAQLPFSFVQNHDFIGMIQSFSPQFTGYSANTLKRNVMKMFSTKKAALHRYLSAFDGKICLTSDVWTSSRRMGYMSLTAHFIDKDWSLNKSILSFKMIEYPQSGETLAQHIYDELVSWQIHEKVFSITLDDNLSNNDVLLNLLPSFLMLPSVPNQLFHVRCCANILNLIVQDGFSILSPTIEKITTIVRSMNSSKKRHEIWVHACTDLALGKINIDNDVPHRWDSTYDLLLLALKYKSALRKYVLVLNQSGNCNLDIPDENDWLIANLACNFLGIFNTSTKICCDVYFPTSNRVICSLVDIYQTFVAFSNINVFENALVAMKSKFDKYWSSFPMVFCLATIMDPRFKLLAIQEWLKCFGLVDLEIEVKLAIIKLTLHQCYDIYKRNVVPASAAREPSNETPLLYISTSAGTPVVQSFSMQRLKRARLSSTSSSQTSDLQVYLDLPTIEVDDDNSFNLLGWWKSNQSMYPILYVLARDLLAVPASTVPSDAAFSTDERVLSEEMDGLSPNSIEALVCLKDWSLARSRGQEAAREEAAEEMMAVRASRPDWMVDDELEPVLQFAVPDDMTEEGAPT